MFINGHRKEESISCHARKYTGNQKIAIGKKFSKLVSASNGGAGPSGDPDDKSTYLLQKLMFKQQNYHSNYLSSILFSQLFDQC